MDFRTAQRYLIALGLSLSPALSLAENYLCVEEKSTGIVYREAQKAWDATNFSAEDTYTLSDISGAYAIRISGIDQPVATCGAVNEGGIVRCSGFYGQFYINTRSGRFARTMPGFYHLVGIGLFPEDTAEVPPPTVSIGKCTTF